MEQLRRGLKETNLNLTDSEINTLFSYFQSQNKKGFEYIEFVNYFRGQMNPTRLDLVHQIFQIISPNHHLITINQIKSFIVIYIHISICILYIHMHMDSIYTYTYGQYIYICIWIVYIHMHIPIHIHIHIHIPIHINHIYLYIIKEPSESSRCQVRTEIS